MARSFDPMQLGSIELFCKAAELSSFTAAAQALGITPAAVSRSIARLEARLGARLFVRSTRQIRLTDDGRSYYEQCEQALAQIEQAGRVVSGRQGEPSGTLRISVPTTYAHHRLFPSLPAFNAAFPKLKVEVSVSNRNIDLIEEGYDLAIRHGTLADSRLVARTLEEATLGVFASPAYLKRRGTPTHPSELRQHDCINFVLPRTGRPMAWLFREDGVDIERQVDGPVRVHDDVLGCVNHARAGGGLCQIYHFITETAVRNGELKEVLEPYGGRTRPFTILYPHNRHVAPRVRAFVDFMTARLAPDAVGSRRTPSR